MGGQLNREEQELWESGRWVRATVPYGAGKSRAEVSTCFHTREFRTFKSNIPTREFPAY